MSKEVPYLLQGKNIILVVNGKSHTISKDTHMNYGKIVDALKEKDFDAIQELVEPAKAIVNFGKGYVTIVDGKVLWKGQPFNNGLSDRMIEMYQEGFPIDPMVRLMERLMANPSHRSVAQFYSFIEKNKLPITEDGYILAFKRVKSNYFDVHSGTIDNSVGQTVEMDRNLVDDDPNSHCSVGLHFCSESYLQHFGNSCDPVMILKIDPADVVSIPTDYNGAKGRCCKYTVVAQVTGDPATAFVSVINGDYSPKPVVAPVAEPAVASPVKRVAKVKATPVPLTSWPFPLGDLSVPVSAPSVTWPPVTTNTGMYQVQRRNGGATEASNMSLADAREMVAKNVRQKKAQLTIVDSNGKEVK